LLLRGLIVDAIIAATERNVPRVLIAEDELLVRFAISDSLLDEGIVVFEAGTAIEAINVLLANAEIDVVFTDIRMPGSMDGLELANWIHDHRPNLLVVLTSGDVRSSELSGEAGPFIAKPYDFSAVAEYIAALARANRKARVH
jgi:CheY-like chemotaxis protein